MSLVRRIVEPLVGPAYEQRSTRPLDTHSTVESFFGSNTDAGQFVTYDAAMFFSVVHACVRVKADAFVEMPLHVYRRDADGMKERAENTRAYFLLHDEPNPEMSAPETWGICEAHFAIDGNTFLGKTFKDNEVAALWPIRPDWVRIGRERGQLVYYVRDENGDEYPFTQREIVHIRDISWTGMRGFSRVKLAAQQIGAGLAIERFMNDFWANGALPSAVLKTDKDLSEASHRKLVRRFLRAYRSRRRGVVVLEDGLDFQPVSLNHVDSQFIEQKRELVETIARVWRVPLSRLSTQASGSSMTYRNLESENVQFHLDAVLPDAIRFEGGLHRHRDLFPTRDRLFPEFLADAFLRADAKTRAEIDRIALGGAAYLLPSEKRRRENLPADERLDEKALAQGVAPARPEIDENEPEEDRDKDE